MAYVVRAHADGMAMGDDFVSESEIIAGARFSSAVDFFRRADTGVEVSVQLFEFESGDILAESSIAGTV